MKFASNLLTQIILNTDVSTLYWPVKHEFHLQETKQLYSDIFLKEDYTTDYLEIRDDALKDLKHYIEFV